MSDSSQPHGLQPTRLLQPWDFLGKSTGVGCHCLLRKVGIPHLKSNSESWNCSSAHLRLSLSCCPLVVVSCQGCTLPAVVLSIFSFSPSLGFLKGSTKAGGRNIKRERSLLFSHVDSESNKIVFNKEKKSTPVYSILSNPSPFSHVSLSPCPAPPPTTHSHIHTKIISLVVAHSPCW